MGDVSDFFKSGFLSMHKNTTGKNYKQKTLKDRMDDFNNIRRTTRNTLIFQKRQIDKNMTPINTPEPTKLVRKVAEKKEAKKPNKRLEMLNKWKAEKEKLKQEAQKRAKPLFKVCHVPIEVGLPNLENINKEIKGKPIKTAPTPVKSQFAPPNHKFRAPKNIKPIEINGRTNNTGAIRKTKMEIEKINSPEANKINSKQNHIFSQRSMRSATSKKEQTSERLVSNLSKKSHIKTEIDRKLRGNKDMLQKTVPVDLKAEDKINVRSKIKEPPQKSTSNISATKKLQYKNSPAIARNTSRDIKLSVKSSSPKKNKTNEKTTTNKKNMSRELSVSNNIKAVGEIKKTPKKNDLKFVEVSNSKNVAIVNEKKKSLRILKQPKLKENNAINVFSSCRESTDITPKKIIGWDVIEILESDDEVFSKAINNRTPKKITKKYKKTPRKRQNIEMSEDSTMKETLTNDKTPIKNISVKNYEVEVEQITTYTNVKSRNSTIRSATGSASPDFPIECVSPTNGGLNNSSRTPLKNVLQEASPVYISPFVTVSRGKSSARKEFQVRHSSGGRLSDTPEFNKDISNNISPKAGADYFVKKLNNETAVIEDMCDEWSKYKNNNNCPEEANDMIDVAIGQSKLLISKKFQQFRDLIYQCKNCEYKEKPVTCEDLHGFWDMIYMQVEDLNKRFKSLNVLKANNWQEIVPEKKPVVKRARGRPRKVVASSSIKNLIEDARNKKKYHVTGENNLIISQETVISDEFIQLNSVKSPVGDQKIPAPRPSTARKSLRVSLLASQAKRMSSSPGLTMMKISQAIKYGDGLTPSKSILKTDLSKSANRITKSVLFKDDLEDNFEKHVKSTKTIRPRNMEYSVNKENDGNEINLISFSPITPTRRSRRLSKIN